MSQMGPLRLLMTVRASKGGVVWVVGVVGVVGVVVAPYFGQPIDQ
jgi:hypothetical protein